MKTKKLITNHKITAMKSQVKKLVLDSTRFFVSVATIGMLMLVRMHYANAQNVGISATGVPPDNSAGLDVNFSNKGLLIPRVALTSSTDATSIPSPATSLLVYNTGTGGLTPAGYYYNAGTPSSPNWVRLLIVGTPADAWLTLGNAGTTAGIHFIGTTDAVDLVFKTNNTEQMRILSNGNVGIGTTNPLVNLVIDGGNSASYVRIQGNSDGDNYGALEIWSNDATPRKWQFAHKSITGRQYDFTFTHFNGTSWSDPFTIKSNGNVGIGTLEPGAKLQVNDGSYQALRVGANIEGLQGGGIIAGHAGGGRHLIINDIAQARWALATGNYDLSIQNDHGGNWNSRVYITEGGNVGIGTTTPAGKFHVNNDADGSDSSFVVTTSGRVGIGTTGPTYQLQLSQNSAAKPYSSTWTVISDKRLKNITGNYTKGLQKLLQLQPITYYYKNPEGDTLFVPEVLAKENVGFTAQEVAKVFPEAVDTASNGYLGLDIHPLLIAYFNAIKELKAENDELKKENKELKKQNDLLKAELEERTQALQTRIEKLEQWLRISAKK